MAYKPGIFQYGTIGADGGGYDDYGFGTDEIYTLPPFKVNENTGNNGTGLNNTFTDLDLQNLYNAGLTGGNIFTGGGGGGGGGSQAPTDDGGYKDPVNIADYKKGLIGPQGYASGRSEYQPINPPGPVVLPKVEVPIGQQGEVGPGGYTDAVNQSLFTQGLIGPAGYSSGTGPSVGPINPPGTVVLPPFEAPGTKINNELDAAAALALLNSIGSGVKTGYVPLATASVFTGPTPSSDTVVLPPFEAPGSMIPNNGIDPASVLRLIQQGYNPANTFTDYTPLATATVFTGPTPSPTPLQLPGVEVPIGPNSQEALNFMNMWLGKVGNLGNPNQLPAVSNFPVVTYPITTLRITVPNPSLPPVTVSNFSPNVTYPPITSSVVPTTTAPVSTVSVTTSVPFDPNSINSGVGTYGTNAQTLTTKRNFGAELAETLKALQDNQAGIMGMYGDLYKKFMPKGITDTESSVIDQYKTDLARLQQRQAGVLAPDDIRQSQQAAREAYGARGQVMGRGAVGAEIMGRENIRQQREDQARAGLQASYGNIMNMANLQTGNIFSPIGNLMSNTFNPLSPYAADVYGTNVNAQLAKEIAQKNYDAAVRSAELSGAAQKSAATTSAAGNILGPAIGGVIGKGLGAIFTSGASLALSCMPGDQCIDTPAGPKAIKDLKGGDSVIGYDGEVAFIAQACSWNQNPLRTFLTITREDGSSFTVCDDHKIMGIPAMEWVEGAELAGSFIKSIEESTGLLTSYDILTNQGGYRINGIPVNSMIPEIVMQVVEFHRQVDRNLQAIST
jgi:hypothetical protein